MPPRALRPTGLVLVDKPAGPSSFAVVKRLRDRTGHGPGMRGRSTRSRPGFCSCCLGSATRLAQYLVGLDKRYVTEVDLRVDDRDRGHRRRSGRGARASAARGARASARAVQWRGHAARARRLGREDRRRACLQALSRGRGRRDAVPRVDDPRARVASVRGRRGDARAARLLGDVRPRRSPTRSAGTAARFAAPPLGRSRWTTPTRSRSCRRPTRCRSCPHRSLAGRGRRGSHGPAANRAACARDVRRRARRGRRDRAAVNVAHDPAELDPRPRAVAIGVFDGVHLGHQAVLRAAGRHGPRRHGDHVRPSSAARSRLRRRAARDARAPSRALRAGRRRGDARRSSSRTSSSSRSRRSSPRAFCAGSAPRSSWPARTSASAHRRRGDLAFLEEHGFSVVRVPPLEGASSTRIRELLPRGRRRSGGAGSSGGHRRWTGIVVVGDERGGTLGFPTANLSVEPHLLVPAFGIYAGAALGGRAAISIGTNPHYGGARAAHRGAPARLRGRSLRPAARRRAVAEAPRRARVLERGGARRADRARRGADAGRRAAGLGGAATLAARPHPGRWRVQGRAAPCWDRRQTSLRRRFDDPDERSQAGDRRQARPARQGHGLDRGADRAAHDAHRRSSPSTCARTRRITTRGAGLLKLVGRRRRLLDYLQRTNLEGYRALIQELGLRR